MFEKQFTKTNTYGITWLYWACFAGSSNKPDISHSQRAGWLKRSERQLSGLWLPSPSDLESGSVRSATSLQPADNMLL